MQIQILSVPKQVKCNTIFLIFKNLFHFRTLFRQIYFLQPSFSCFSVLSFQLKILVFNLCFNFSWKCLIRILKVISRQANFQEEILIVFSTSWQGVSSNKDGGNKINRMVKSIEGQIVFYTERCNFIYLWSLCFANVLSTPTSHGSQSQYLYARMFHCLINPRGNQVFLLSRKKKNVLYQLVSGSSTSHSHFYASTLRKRKGQISKRV